MQEAQKYRKFATECRRLAASASEKDKGVLLQIAEAWDAQAKIAAAAILEKADSKLDGASPKT
jgi:hypothetical protein